MHGQKKTSKKVKVCKLTQRFSAPYSKLTFIHSQLVPYFYLTM
jgi:hypothetical protein